MPFFALTSLSDADRSRLGDILEDLTANALKLLKDLERIKDFRDLRPTVEEYAHKQRTHDYPDFWVQLIDNSEVEIECKNLGKRPKEYLMGKKRETDWWAYDMRWIKPHMTKVWTKGAKKVLVVSSLDVFNPWDGTVGYLRMNLDGIVEASAPGEANPQILDDPKGMTRDHIAVGLYGYFEKWVKA